jgi:hypothetical protein
MLATGQGSTLGTDAPATNVPSPRDQSETWLPGCPNSRAPSLITRGHLGDGGSPSGRALAGCGRAHGSLRVCSAHTYRRPAATSLEPRPGGTSPPSSRTQRTGRVRPLMPFGWAGKPAAQRQPSAGTTRRGSYPRPLSAGSMWRWPRWPGRPWQAPALRRRKQRCQVGDPRG